jgi:RNA polymerase sigma factor (TIGR02999 family)
VSEVTHLIEAMDNGDARAAAELLPLVYQELRRLARAQMSNERVAHTLQATALVHEAYLRLTGKNANDKAWNGRGHFFAAASEAMRRILIEHARRRNSLKRGGGQARIDFPDDLADLPVIESPCGDVDDLLALDDALKHLEGAHPDKAELIKLLYFAGLSLDEAAAAMGISKTTAHRHAAFARAWLYDAMERADG